MHHKIVVLEAIHMKIPTFTIPPTHTADQIHYPLTSASEVQERIKEATIIVCTTVKLTANLLSPFITPHLQLISQLGTGYDNVDLEACKARGIRVCNTPGGNVDSVAEHALALYFAGRRNIEVVHRHTVVGEWKDRGSITKYLRDGEGKAPPGCRDEIVGIIGFGAIGKRIASLLRALGMKILVADRKSAGTPAQQETITMQQQGEGEIDLANPRRTSFQSILKHCTTIIIVCPLNTETRNLISTAELASMRKNALVVNVARGGIVDEVAMAKALNEKQIAGYATDVFATEPSDKEDTPLLGGLVDDAHFMASPHVAWFSDTTMVNLTKLLTNNVEGFLKGEPQNLVA